MSDPRLQRIEHLFHQAADLPPDRRASFLDAHAGEDQALRREVESLLGCFEQPCTASLGLLAREGIPDLVGQQIDRYHVVELIGEGGFGSVFLAEEGPPLHRKVALKVIKLGMDTRQVIARFDTERQALARMDHPHIARVLDAGATRTGRPYFVMELVQGIPVDRFCDENALPLRARLELFIQICHAVQHAHQKGVIHRDLKPSNVLVELLDGRPMPKVIDFGIAKATEHQDADHTCFTELRQILGSPDYMSPEQAGHRRMDVDTRTDVYSLGVLLYELLAGCRPFARETMARAAHDEVLRIIREESPPPPSVRFRKLGPRREPLARCRSTASRTLQLRLQGDLDWIVMMGLAKEPDRRYPTVAGLASDIQRHLDGEPVVAGPPRWTYRVGKFMRRNRLAVFASAVTLGIILVCLLLAIRGFVLASRARTDLERKRRVAESHAHKARSETKKAQLVGGFLRDMLASASPWTGSDRNDLLPAMLDRAAHRVDCGALDGQPELEGVIRLTLGQTYAALGRHTPATRHLEAAVELLDHALGPVDPDTVKARRALGVHYRSLGKLAASRSLLEKTRSDARRAFGADHPLTLSVEDSLGFTLWQLNQADRAEPCLRRALTGRKRRLGEAHPDTIETFVNLGTVLATRRDFPQAELTLEMALESSRRYLGPDHPYTLRAMNHLAAAHCTRTRYGQAEPLFREIVSATRRILGPDHPRTTIAEHGHFSVLSWLGRAHEFRERLPSLITRLERLASRPDARADDLVRYASVLLRFEPMQFPEAAARLMPQDTNPIHSVSTLASRAEKTIRQALVLMRRDLGERHPQVTSTMNLLATALFVQGKLDETERLNRNIAQRQRRIEGMEAHDTLKALVNLGATLVFQGKPEQATRILRRVIEMPPDVLGPGHVDRGKALSHLSLAARLRGRMAEALRFSRRALDIQTARLGEDHHETRTTRQVVLDLLVRTGAAEEARQLALERIRHIQKTAAPSGPEPAALCEWIALLPLAGPAAAREAPTAMALAEELVHRTGGRTLRALEALALACHESGRLERAIRVQQRALALDRARISERFSAGEVRLLTWGGKQDGFPGMAAAYIHILASRMSRPVSAP